MIFPHLQTLLVLVLSSRYVLAQESESMNDVQTIRLHRTDAMVVSGASRASSIGDWLSTLDADGKWPDSDINYTSGCDAQRANWPAGEHWTRIASLAAAHHGGTSDISQWVGNADVRSAVTRAMDWWFSRDMATDACLDGGGGDGCPCGTSGLWNTNWFSNVLLVPNLVVQSCLLFDQYLSDSQKTSCSHFALRASSPLYRPSPPGFVSGANILEISRIMIDNAVRVNNASGLEEAYGRIHQQMVVEPKILLDGIKPDGSFGQHLGLLYNGNYGKDFVNSVLALEEAAGGTQFSADEDERNVFASLIEADRWMVVANTETNTIHWDLSVLPRFISFAVKDDQATADININVTQIGSVGKLWANDQISQVATALSSGFAEANASKLMGNRHFWSNDYLVHRGASYVTSVKMYSSRTLNTECTNSQNPLGFHLADGAVFTYKTGAEYEDIAAAWDWNLIPGTTVDYGATPLTCDTAKFQGIEEFVGGASTGQIGAAVMRYTNPSTKNLSWQKAWFFLDNEVQHVMVSNIASKSGAQVLSVLDQKKRNGQIIINGQMLSDPFTNASDTRTFWHDNVGYTFDGPKYPTVSVRTGESTGDWSAIGTGTQPPAKVNLFAASIVHDDLSAPVAYTVYPASDLVAFDSKRQSSGVRTVQNDARISAVWDEKHRTAIVVFWDEAGGSVTFDNTGAGPTTLSASANAVVIYQLEPGSLTVSDPGQTLSSVQVTVSDRKTDVPLPSGGLAGSSVSMTFKGDSGPAILQGSGEPNTTSTNQAKGAARVSFALNSAFLVATFTLTAAYFH